MPLYDYRCEKCGEVFEVRQSFSDATLTVHEGCSGDVKRLISVPAIQFKGTGWYVTDYARKGSGGSDSGGKNDGASGESPDVFRKSLNEREKEPSKSGPVPQRSQHLPPGGRSRRE